MPILPKQVNSISLAGSQWTQTYTLTDSTSAPLNLTGLVFEMVIRPTATDTVEPPLISATSTSPTAQGSIAITPLTGVVTVTLTPAATALLRDGTYPYALWSSPGTSSAICWIDGILSSQLVPIP